MHAPFLEWLDQRTNYRALIHESLYERVPGGARWRYVWGSTLVFAFSIQVITGLALWMSYSPSSTTAWESVYYIQHEVTLGWFLRGIHHFMAQAMIILMGLHLVQVVIDGAYRAPREVNFWLGLILMQIVLGLSLTGYLLPWDQKGYWATQVATNIAGIVPVFGAQIKQAMIGGSTYGHLTLTRFFALHAGVLPTLLVGFLVLHIAAFRRHGICAPDPLHRPDTTFWPDQVLRDAVACLGVMVAVIGVMFLLRGGGPEGGAELGAPADPADQYSAARPEWYFLFLFQFLKWFPGESEIYGAIVIPGLAMLALAIMPFTGRLSIGHKANVVFLFGLLAGVAYLTFEAVKQDVNDPEYKRAVAQAERNAHRVKELIHEKGIGVEGAGALLRNDFATQGPKLFAQNCASCHRHNGTDGTGKTPTDKATASDLGTFGTREWMAGMITHPADPTYFGNSPPHVKGEMANWSKTHGKNLSPEEVDKAAEYLLSLGASEQLNADKVKAGKQIVLGPYDKLETTCSACHIIQNDEEAKTATEAGGLGPELTNYGSREWLIKFISNPEDIYLENNHMPAFGAKLTTQQLEMIVDWLRMPHETTGKH